MSENQQKQRVTAKCTQSPTATRTMKMLGMLSMPDYIDRSVDLPDSTECHPDSLGKSAPSAA